MLLSDLPNVFVCIDDILITGTDEENYLYNFEHVLEKLEKAGLTLKEPKCILQLSQLNTWDTSLTNMAYIHLRPKYKQLSKSHNVSLSLSLTLSLSEQFLNSLLKN